MGENIWATLYIIMTKFWKNVRFVGLRTAKRLKFRPDTLWSEINVPPGINMPPGTLD